MTISVNRQSHHALEAIKEDTHALLITGPVGIGLATIAQEYVKGGKWQILTVLPEKNDKVDLEKGTLTVESIRRLYTMTRTVEPSGRVVLIDYAERMAPAAQNAFLKLLEEPAEGTRFVLLTHQPELLLPTITSRVQRVDMRPVTTEQSVALLDELGVRDATKRAQLLFIAEGLPAEMTRLARDEARFEARASLVKDARSFVTGSAYERLLIAKKYKDSREDALVLVQDALKLLRRSVATSGDAASLRMLSRLEKLHQRLSQQGNVRLQLSAAVV